MGILTVSVPVHAYNNPTHQQLTALSYEMMRRVAWELNEAPDGASLASAAAPEGVADETWQAFLDDIALASGAWRDHSAGLPAPQSSFCEGVQGIDLANDWGSGPMGSLPHAPRYDYRTTSDCGLERDWRPSGIFNESNPNAEPTGAVLGFWAATVDDEINDTHLWIRPTSAGGAGAIKDFFNDAIAFTLGAVIAAIICLFDCIFNGCDACPSPDDVGDSINVIDDLEGLIPGIGDISGADYVGFWHHINMGDWADNDYDDRQGLHLEDGGYGGGYDPVEVALMLGMDLIGMSVNWSDSLGVHRYSIEDANDGHEDTEIRNQGEWQYSTWVHTPMEPLDNLAFFGWSKFLKTHDTRYLAWPLHAFGDAVAPHHVIGSPAWGHRPFEDAYQSLWFAVRYQPEADPFGDVGRGAQRAQLQQMTRVLHRAWAWRNHVNLWRTMPGHSSTGLPVRDMITQLAQQTYEASNESMFSDGWPYDIAMSTAYLLGGEDVDEPGWGIEYYEDRDPNGDRARPLFENSMGAQIAFLLFAAEVL